MRLQKENVPFTQVANSVLYDKRLSLKAKGLYAYLFSKPDGWKFSALRIATDGIEGIKVIWRTLSELECAGYLERRKHQDGTMDYYLRFSQVVPTSQNGSLPKQQPAKTGGISNTEKNSNKEEESNKYPAEPSARGDEDHRELMMEKGKAHTEFIRLYCEAYQADFGDKYAFQVKDAKAANILLNSSKLQPKELVAIARKAWAKNGFMAKWATSITGFNSKFNEIRQEIKQERVSIFAKPKEKAPVGAAYRPLNEAEDAENWREMKWVEEQNKKHEAQKTRNNDRRPT